ncbi:MAG: hypothetical protein EOM91_15955 [Sphingobacteriia bacterium]|nr:hypothetical protein [Sphingobacteriia bacterium]
MNGWQKLESISKIIAALMIPLAVAYLGNQVATANKQRESETKFVELATAILANEPHPDQSEESKDLRRWAVAVIDRYSGVPMSRDTAKALIMSTALPTNPASPSDPAGTWGLVFGGDTTLDAARHEVTKTAERMGIEQGEIFRRDGSFRSVRVYVSRSDAQAALEKARGVRSSSYLVPERKP